MFSCPFGFTFAFDPLWTFQEAANMALPIATSPLRSKGEGDRSAQLGGGGAGMYASGSAMAAARRFRRQLSRPEYLLWLRLKQLRGSGTRIRRQHPLGPYVADFYCPAARLVIEIDGLHHEYRQERDQRRSDYFVSLGLQTVRLKAKAVLADPDGCADAIMALCRAGAGPSTTQPFDFAQD